MLSNLAARFIKFSISIYRQTNANDTFLHSSDLVLLLQLDPHKNHRKRL